MAQKVCKHCRKKVSGRHHCPKVGRDISFDNSDDFLSTYAATAILSGSDDGSGGGCGDSDSGGGCDGGGGGGD